MKYPLDTAENSVQTIDVSSTARRWSWRSLVGRLLLVALMFFVEKVFLDQFVNFDLADSSEGLGAIVRTTQHWLFRFAAVFGAAILVFAFATRRSRPSEVSPSFAMLRPRWILAHLFFLGILAELSHSIYRGTTSELSVALIASAGLVVGVILVVTALLALAPKSVWADDARSLGNAWIYAAIIAGFATSAIGVLQNLWRPFSALTFYLVTALVRPVVPALQADPNQLILNTGRFAIQVAGACSGLEGIGLIIAFSVAWLTYFRHEYVFPRSLWIIPIGIVTMFGLNTIRIATLLLIGHAGYPGVALFGFHSQAGWIAFIVGAGAVVLLSRRPVFLQARALPETAAATRDENPTAAYLVPLLAVLAAGMVSRATSGQFEVLYPLRFVAGLAALWAYRGTLKRAVDWRFTWRGPATGVVIGILTISFVHFLATPDSLDSTVMLSPLARFAGMVGRCGAALVTAPLTEELAYRGFLMRRIARPDFDAMPFMSVRWPAIVLTALVSAGIQGSLFLPAVLAGIAYGAVVVHRGKFGDAVIAHAVANAALMPVAWKWAPW
jgi:exosortase E/protease (VPEID-CTERM system)